MNIHNFSETVSLFNVFLSELRNIDIQKDSMRFRKNLERTAEIMSYEVSKTLPFEPQIISTPLGETSAQQLVEQPIIATILRAGLGMHNGLLRYFDRAESAFVSAFRKHITIDEFEIYVEYIASPSLKGKTLIISDPMLATGNSMLTAYEALKKQSGTPLKTHILSLIAHPDALELLEKNLPSSTEIWVGAIDTELTAQSYIVPGMGDTGDLAYGTKL